MFMSTKIDGLACSLRHKGKKYEWLFFIIIIFLKVVFYLCQNNDFMIILIYSHPSALKKSLSWTSSQVCFKNKHFLVLRNSYNTAKYLFSSETFRVNILEQHKIYSWDVFVDCYVNIVRAMWTEQRTTHLSREPLNIFTVNSCTYA